MFRSKIPQFNERIRSTKEIVEEMFTPESQKVESLGYRIFCIPIRKSWTFKTQIIVSLIILNIISFVLIGFVLGIDCFIIKNSIYSSSVGFLEGLTSNSLVQATQQFSLILSLSIQKQFQILNIVSGFFLDQYDATRNNTYLNLTGCGIIEDLASNDLHFLGDDLSSDCNDINSSFVSNFFKLGAKEICFDDVAYSDYGSADKVDKKTYSDSGGKILKAAKILKYVTGDQFYNMQVNFMTNIYMAFDIDCLLLYYPATKYIILNLSTFDPTQRPWYINTKTLYLENSYLGEQFVYLTDPYTDVISNTRIVTISKPILSDNEFIGVIACDMSMNDMQSSFLQDKSSFNNSIIFLVNQEGLILNNPFTETNITPSYNITETDLTNLTESDWIKINDRSTENSTFVANQGQTVIVKAFINSSYSSSVYYILIFCIEISEVQKEINEAKNLMNETFIYLIVILLFVVFGAVLAAVIASTILVNKLIQPLMKLTLYAKAVSQTAHANDENKKIKRKVSFDIDQLKGNGLIGELITTFRSLVKTLKVNTKKKREKASTIKENRMKFPVVVIKPDFKEIYNLIERIEDSQKN